MVTARYGIRCRDAVLSSGLVSRYSDTMSPVYTKYWPLLCWEPIGSNGVPEIAAGASVQCSHDVLPVLAGVPHVEEVGHWCPAVRNGRQPGAKLEANELRKEAGGMLPNADGVSWNECFR